MLICPECNQTNNPAARFCAYCGFALVALVAPAPVAVGVAEREAAPPPAAGPAGPAAPPREADDPGTVYTDAGPVVLEPEDQVAEVPWRPAGPIEPADVMEVKELVAANVSAEALPRRRVIPSEQPVRRYNPWHVLFGFLTLLTILVLIVAIVVASLGVAVQSAVSNADARRLLGSLDHSIGSAIGANQAMGGSLNRFLGPDRASPRVTALGFHLPEEDNYQLFEGLLAQANVAQLLPIGRQAIQAARSDLARVPTISMTMEYRDAFEMKRKAVDALAESYNRQAALIGQIRSYLGTYKTIGAIQTTFSADPNNSGYFLLRMNSVVNNVRAGSFDQARKAAQNFRDEAQKNLNDLNGALAALKQQRISDPLGLGDAAYDQAPLLQLFNKDHPLLKSYADSQARLANTYNKLAVFVDAAAKNDQNQVTALLTEIERDAQEINEASLAIRSADVSEASRQWQELNWRQPMQAGNYTLGHAQALSQLGDDIAAGYRHK